MQGTIAQTIGLVLAANARKRGIPTIGWPNGSIFNFCNSVQFIGRKRDGILGFGQSTLAKDPNAWLQTLPSNMLKAQLNVFSRGDPNVSDRNSVGFANGGPVFVAQIIGTPLEAWIADWAVTNQSDAERRIWSVSYRNVPNLPTEVRSLSVLEVRKRLIAAIEDALRFAEKNGMGFQGIFQTALAAIDDKNPVADFFHADMFPAGLLKVEHLQIFICAAKAWVFGGMGSWNDIWFDGDNGEVYLELSDRLFSTIIDGLVLATNASASGS